MFRPFKYYRLVFCEYVEKVLENESEQLRGFLNAINTNLRAVDMEVKKGIEEDTGRACYVFINTVDNAFLLGTGRYTQRQMDYFKILVIYSIIL